MMVREDGSITTGAGFNLPLSAQIKVVEDWLEQDSNDMVYTCWYSIKNLLIPIIRAAKQEEK